MLLDITTLVVSHLDVVNAIRLASATRAGRAAIMHMIQNRPEMRARRVALALADDLKGYFRLFRFASRVRAESYYEEPVMRGGWRVDYVTFVDRDIPLRALYIQEWLSDRIFAVVEFNATSSAVNVTIYARPVDGVLAFVNVVVQIKPATDATGTVVDRHRNTERAYAGGVWGAVMDALWGV
jgi:hypothetical protein